MFSRRAVLVPLAVAACTSATARGPGPGGSARETLPPAARLELAIDNLLSDPALAHSGSAVLVVSLERGDTLYAREADRLYTPASNLKLFTAASALHYLGPDYRFVTTLGAVGTLSGDTLHGDLLLIGRGDPDLVSTDIEALADTLAMRGARVVTGDVRADASYFEGLEWGSGWMWDDGPFWYWPYVSALTVNDNAVAVHVRPGSAPGELVDARLVPSTAYVDLDVRARTVRADSAPALEVERHWTPKANAIDVLGTLPVGADPVVEIRTVEDPALYAATLLSEMLAARGIEVLGTVRHGPLMAAPVDTIAIHRSDSLAVSVRNFLKISDNLSGEQFVKVMGAEVAGPPGTYDKGLAAERAFLAGEVGLDTLAMNLADGSGVSRYNLVTAGQIVALLIYMTKQDDLWPAFIAALPLAAVDGTLEDRMAGTPAAGRARAKTGSLSGVSALSGYVSSATGEPLAFSVLMEFFTGPTAPRHALQDSLVVWLSRFGR